MCFDSNFFPVPGLEISERVFEGLDQFYILGGKKSQRGKVRPRFSNSLLSKSSGFSRKRDINFLKSTNGFFNYLISPSSMFSRISINILLRLVHFAYFQSKKKIIPLTLSIR
jgi:hypothetical protein